MSCLLVVCRNMGTFIGRFKATCKEANVRIPDFTTQSEFWFLIEPVYQYNTLSDYLKTLESNGLGMEPLYFIQMGITLYSMIFDAHSVDIGLYGITEESLRVGVDGSLYFVGFEYCMPLVQNNQIKPKPWMNPSHVEAPNFKVFRKNQYIKEADAFFASRLLDKIAQQNLSRKHSRFYKQVSTLLQSGLMVSHQKRATAQSLMESFERLRLNALNIKSTPSYTSVLMRQYTTENKSTPHFWELDVQEKTFDAADTPSTSRADTRNFKNLLDKLFATSNQPSPEPPIEPLTQSSTSTDNTKSLIQQKLLDMVLKKSRPIKEKSPLPRPLASSVFGRQTQDKSLQEILDMIDKEDSMNYTTSEDQRIQAKQKEVQTIQTILDTTASSDLLELIEKEINHTSDKYPAYYPRVLAAAISHASTKDPYVALTIFEMAKTKSIYSYLIGCTVDVYNTMLMMRWEVWRDVHGMLNLVEEMTLNGIEFDRHSRQIVKQAIQEIEGEGGPDFASGVFWNADEKRSCHLMKELVGKWLI
ncbi:hypothetical protein BD560DRAFT_340635 [Blakeslea trispora]|nr:hypothetical protein BD560DRAFT_340635 [Blakeslea trispora]